MTAAAHPRIVEVYRDLRWQQTPHRLHLDAPTARMLRADGITMVRLATPLCVRLFRRSRRVGPREVSLARYLGFPGPASP